MRTDNVQMLTDTLQICEQGYYLHNGRKVKLKLSPAEMRSVRVFLPDEIAALAEYKDFQHVHVIGRCGHGCENMDSFSLARKRYEDCGYMFTGKDAKEILVLNLANPVNPGGGVRRGARAQEEDLCRKSSLLLSLEGRAAREYYEYNRALHTYMGSDAIIITPKVEIIKDENGELLDESVIVAVMTCAAPCLTNGMEGLTQKQYEDMVYNRIVGMLRCAAYMGYKNLVLGAFGCGAFGNDAKIVSDLFYRALKEFDFDGMKEKDMFRRIDFAVLSRGHEQYNFKEFYRNFGDNNFYRDEDNAVRMRALERIKETERNLDKIRGSLIGGAIGDALGYPVEFLSRDMIVEKYGEPGITEYELDRRSGKALISDDTQMTLFTANGILVGETRLCMRGIGGVPSAYVPQSYQDWLTTQEEDYQTEKHTKRYNRNGGISWLLDVPELYSRRAPGNTCLSALIEARQNQGGGDYIENPRNSSKGCGGIMRVAPLGIHYGSIPVETLDKEAAVLSAITHGHPLGYLPSAVLTHILNRIVFPGEQHLMLKEIIVEAKETVRRLFEGTEYVDELCEIVDKAIELAENEDTDVNNIKRLGEGWVAEETLAIAIYCALRYEHDFSGGIIAAVNHDGDSDSTGAVVGNILGAINGYDAIESKWKQKLELLEVLLEMSADLCHGCHMSEYSTYHDADWARKYMDMHWKDPEPECVFFWHEYDVNGCFSNWYTSPFVIDDFCYDHVEQYLMAQKAKLFHDARAYTAILKATNPKECKRLGREVKPFDAATWDKVRYKVLLAGVRAKFSQNEELKKKLLATGNAILAEASPYDDIFGIKLDAHSAATVPCEQWPGKNLLGKALMEVRAELAGETPVEDIINSSRLDTINRILRNGETC